MAADPIQRLVRELARLPGIGEKSATRLAMHLVRSPKPQVRELAQALIDATEQIGLCSTCMTLTAEDPCRLCADTRRDNDVVCVVAQPSVRHPRSHGSSSAGTRRWRCVARDAAAGSRASGNCSEALICDMWMSARTPPAWLGHPAGPP